MCAQVQYLQCNSNSEKNTLENPAQAKSIQNYKQIHMTYSWLQQTNWPGEKGLLLKSVLNYI